jgi:hypothetical protein
MLDVSRCRWLGITVPGYRGNRGQQASSPKRTTGKP